MDCDAIMDRVYRCSQRGLLMRSTGPCIGCFVPPKPEVILTAEEEAKAQKALVARNREREQNKLRMRRVREAQRAAKEAEKVSSPAG